MDSCFGGSGHLPRSGHALTTVIDNLNVEERIDVIAFKRSDRRLTDTHALGDSLLAKLMLLAEAYQILEKAILRIDQQICAVLKALITH